MMNTGARTHIPRIGILSPATEPGMRDWWKEFMQGLTSSGTWKDRTSSLFGDSPTESSSDCPLLRPSSRGLALMSSCPQLLPLSGLRNPYPAAFQLYFRSASIPSKPASWRASIDPEATSPEWRPCHGGIVVRDWLSFGKSFQRLHALRPSITPRTQPSNSDKETRTAARDLGLELIVLKFATAEEIDRTFEVARTKGSEALLPTSDPLAFDNAKKIGALSLQRRIPVISPFREITDAGGVLGYGPDLSTLFRRSAAVVDRILKGSNPGDIPIGEPQKFDISINLMSSRALNLTIRTLSCRAQRFWFSKTSDALSSNPAAMFVVGTSRHSRCCNIAGRDWATTDIGRHWRWIARSQLTHSGHCVGRTRNMAMLGS